jgi:hypothetical protein
MRIFPLEAKDDGIYITIRLDEDEYQRLARGDRIKEWAKPQIVKGKSSPGEAAVFYEALGEYIVSYAGVISGS